jgi:hypothetical protein
MKQTKYFWARYKSDKAFDINSEKLNDINDWFIVEKIYSKVLSSTFYKSMNGSEFWENHDNELADIELSDFQIERPYKVDEMHYLYEQEQELKKLFNIQD